MVGEVCLRRPAIVASVVALTFLATPATAAPVGTVRVEVRVTSREVPLITAERVREEMAKAVAERLEERYRGYWRFEAGEVGVDEPGLRLHVEDGESAGEVRLRLEPVAMELPSGSERWTSAWYRPGDLAIEVPPTPRNAPELVAEGLSELLDEHGETIQEALKSVPVGVGAAWHPEDRELVVLALPWERFEGSRAVFRIRCAFQRESGVEVPVELYTAGLGSKAPYPRDGESFEALLAIPQHRVFAGECKPVREVMDEVRTFQMHEILLEAERSTQLMSAASGC